MTTSNNKYPLFTVLVGDIAAKDTKTCDWLRRNGCRLFDQSQVEKEPGLVTMVQGVLLSDNSPNALFTLPKEDFENLKFISKSGAGVDGFDVAGWRRRGVVTLISPDAVTDSTAEFAVTLLLASARRLKELMAHDSYGRRFDLLGKHLTGSTVGVIGMGRIGMKFAKRMKGFNVKIIYHQRHRKSELEETEFGLVFCSTLEELCSSSDFIVVCCPLTEETRGLIDKRQLDLMKSTAVLINVARGEVIDQPALEAALISGSIGGAALDVTTPEPLPDDHPLRHLPNCLITPHAAWGTEEALAGLLREAAENLVGALKGERFSTALD